MWDFNYMHAHSPGPNAGLHLLGVPSVLLQQLKLLGVTFGPQAANSPSIHYLL